METPIFLRILMHNDKRMLNKPKIREKQSWKLGLEMRKPGKTLSKIKHFYER